MQICDFRFRSHSISPAAGVSGRAHCEFICHLRWPCSQCFLAAEPKSILSQGAHQILSQHIIISLSGIAHTIAALSTPVTARPVFILAEKRKKMLKERTGSNFHITIYRRRIEREKERAQCINKSGNAAANKNNARPTFYYCMHDFINNTHSSTRPGKWRKRQRSNALAFGCGASSPFPLAPGMRLVGAKVPTASRTTLAKSHWLRITDQVTASPNPCSTIWYASNCKTSAHYRLLPLLLHGAGKLLENKTS